MQALAVTIIGLIISSIVVFILYGLISIWLEGWGYSSRKGGVSSTKFFCELATRIFGILSFICGLAFAVSLLVLAFGSKVPIFSTMFWGGLGGFIIFLSLGFFVAGVRDKQ